MRSILGLAVSVLVAIGIGVGILAGTSPASSPANWTISPGPPLLRLAARGPCPASVRQAHDVANPGSGLATRLLPPGAVFGHLCRYGASGAASSALVAHAIVNGRTANDFERALAALSTRRPTGVYHCPAGRAQVSVLAFGFLGRPDIDLWFLDSGCRTVDNGLLRAAEVESPRAFARFASIVDLLAPVAPRA